jgi:hypothetical protein
MFKRLINKIKRKKYLSNLKKTNPEQYEIEFKYSPERGSHNFTFIDWINENANFLGVLFGFLSLIVAIIALFYSSN